MPQVKRSSSHHSPSAFHQGVDQGLESGVLQLQRVPRRIPHQTVLMSVPVLRVQNRLPPKESKDSPTDSSRADSPRADSSRADSPRADSSSKDSPATFPTAKTPLPTSPAAKTPPRSTLEAKGGDRDTDDAIDVEKLYVAMTDGEDNDNKYILFCKFL